MCAKYPVDRCDAVLTLDAIDVSPTGDCKISYIPCLAHALEPHAWVQFPLPYDVYDIRRQDFHP